MMCSKVTVNSIIGQERYLRNAKRGARTKKLFLELVQVWENTEIVETVAYDF